MGILATIERSAVESRSTTHGLTIEEVFGDRSGTRSGVNMTEKKSMELSPVFAAVRRLSEDVAKTPRRLFLETDRGRDRQRDNRLDLLVRRRVNPEMSAFKFFEILQGHVTLWGNAYAEIERDGAGRAIGLWPLTPDRVRRERLGGSQRGRIVYWITVDDREIALSPDRVFHLQGFGWDGEGGLSVIRLARESLGLTAAAERYGAQHFGRGGRPSGVLQTDAKFESPEAKENMRRDWERMHEGLDNAHRIAILDQGVTWEQIGIPPEDAQFLQTRQFQVTEVARWFLMPPHKIMDLERSTFSNIEHQSIEYVQDTLVSWYTRWEEEMTVQLLTEREASEGLYFDFNEKALLRGDTAARAQFYKSMFEVAAMSPNDILALEEMNPVEGGDTRFVPMNMIPLDQAIDPPEPPPVQAPPPVGEEADEEGGDEDERTHARTVTEQRKEERQRRSLDARLRLRRRHQSLLQKEGQAVVRREVDGIRAAMNRSFGGRDDPRLRELIDEFYADFPEWVSARFLAVMLTYAGAVGDQAAQEAGATASPEMEEFVRRYTETMGRRWTGASANQIRDLIRTTEASELEVALNERLDEWEATRAEREAAREVVEAGDAVAKYVWAAVGVTVLRWMANPGACPLCDSMNGRVVGIEGAFLREGDTLDVGDESTPPLRPRTDITHPPLHRGCDCAIVPE